LRYGLRLGAPRARGYITVFLFTFHSSLISEAKASRYGLRLGAPRAHSYNFIPYPFLPSSHLTVQPSSRYFSKAPLCSYITVFSLHFSLFTY